MSAAELHLACSCAADGRYAPHSAAMIHSALAHGGDLDVHIHYLTGPGFPADAANRLRAMVDDGGGFITFHRIPGDRVEGLPVLPHAPVSLWYRIFLPTVLTDHPRVLYLDLDTIVLDDLRPLWRTDLGDAYLGAVTNVFMREHQGRGPHLGLASDHDYFNSGVMLMNLEAWREDDATERIREYALRNAPRMGWADQDVMNVLLGHRRLRLHPRWNAMNSILNFPWSVETFDGRTLEEARTHPGIRHFEGPSINKPWHYMCEHRLRDEYFSHRRQTPWPRCRLEGRTPANVVKRWKRDRRAAVAATP